jgi:hypothetical protein
MMLNLDIAASALTELKEKLPSISQDYLCTDATAPCGLRPHQFDLIIEKGTLDALMSAESMIEAVQTATALLQEIRRLLHPQGFAFLVSHSPTRDQEISRAGLHIAGVHKCYLSDESIIINSLRTSGNEQSTLVEKLKNEDTTIEAFAEVRERIVRKNTALMVRKFMKNPAFKDERLRGELPINNKKQDFCWIYVLNLI